MYNLITIQDIKELTKGEFGNEYDYLLGSILIPAVGQSFAYYCNRPDFDQTAHVEYLSPRPYSRTLFLKSPPVAPAADGPPEIEALRLYEDTSYPRAYGAETELVSGTDFIVDEATGMIEHVNRWSGGPKSIKVTYTGGFATGHAAGVPADLKLAAVMQVKILFDRREELNLSGRSLEGGSINMLTPPALPRAVTMYLDPYRIMRV